MSLKSILKKIIPVSAENKQQTLEELLDKLPKGAREAAEIGAVRSGLSKNPEYAKKASKFYEDKQNSILMSRLAFLSGNPEEAIKILERESFIGDAAQAAKEYVGFERAVKVYEDAIEKKNSGRLQEDLAHLYEEQGDIANAQKHIRQAIQMYEKEGPLHMAIALEREYGTIDNVIEMYIKAAESTKHWGYYVEAADTAKKSGYHEKARELYEKTLNLYLEEKNPIISLLHERDMIEIAKKIGDTEKLINLYQRVGMLEEAAELAIQEGYPEKAVGFKSINHQKAAGLAKLAMDRGYLDTAMQIYENADMKKEVAKLAIQSGNPERAIEICQPMMDTTYENGYFTDPEYHDIAIDAALKMNNYPGAVIFYDKAIERFLALGKFDVAARFAEKLDFKNIAEIYRKLASLRKE